MALVSVIVPCFNARAYVGAAIESLLAQTHRDLEVVAVDDGSTDGSAEVLRRYPIAVLSQEHRGAASARNAGIRASRGEHVAFLDADDRCPPDSVARRVAYLSAHPEVAAVYGDSLLEDAQGRPLGRQRPPRYPPDAYAPALFCGLNPISLSTAMARRVALDAVGLFDEALPVIEDADLWLRLSLAHRIGYLDETVAVRRLHRASVTAREGEAYLATGMRLTERYVRAHPAFRPLVAARTAQLHRRYALSLLGAFGGETFDLRGALRALRVAVRHEPFRAATVRALLAWAAAAALGRRNFRHLMRIR